MLIVLCLYFCIFLITKGVKKVVGEEADRLIKGEGVKARFLYVLVLYVHGEPCPEDTKALSL